MIEAIGNASYGGAIYLYCYIGAQSTPKVVFEGNMTLFKLLQVLAHTVFWPLFRAISAYRRS